LTVCVLLAAASGACKKEEPAAETAAQLDTSAAAAPADTGAAQAPAPAPAPPETTAPRIETAPPPVSTAAAPVVQDVPYVSDDTGTIDPGMSEADVVARWGTPVARSRTGAMTYLYFPNSCERSCGTLDVVFLENDKVVDAVLRWEGHRYSGQSSSPPGTTPVATRPTQPNP
jgi:hypothetical protein